jgi:antirestriction protein ArdC
MAASQSRSRKSFAGPTAEEKIVASLIELMEAGSAPWRRPWDGSGGGHHVNLLSGHRYRGANPILLTLGIFPRKGSKAVHVLRPQLHSREEPGVSGEITLRSWASYRPVAVLGAWPVPVSFGGDRACYLPSIDRIQLPDRASFHSPAAFCATWAHEQIHSTGHESRLKRDLGGAFGKARYAREELVAELGAVLLGDRLEIGSEIESHAAYLGHWIELLKETPKVLFQVLSEARQAAELICPEVPGQGEHQRQAHAG